MPTGILPADPSSIARAADVLRGGGLVAFPTETVYGLGPNASGQLSPTAAEHGWPRPDARIDLIPDGGPTPGGIESTVLDLTPPTPRLLRPGLLLAADLEAVVGTVQRAGMSVAELALPSP